MERAGTHPWWKDAIFYEIPVKAFYDADGNGVGDFRGLTARLDYIRDLGATCLWLLPFCPSPWKDDGFDVSDYRAIHPALGRIDDFREFLDAAHLRGLRVAAEVVISHTSDQHPWFQAARMAPAGSELRDYYVWCDAPSGLSAEDSPQTARRGPAAQCWTWDPEARSYYFHRYFTHQPDLNYAHARVRDEMRNVLAFWLELGVDALCLNGASGVNDATGGMQEHTAAAHAALREFRGLIDADFPGRCLEAGMNALPEDAAPYFAEGAGCQLVPMLPLSNRLFLSLADEDCRPVASLLEQLPPPPEDSQWVLFLRNHDELTFPYVTADDEESLWREYGQDAESHRRRGILRRLAPLLRNDRRRLELMFGLLFSLPGAPVLYYGDEIGMGDNVFLGHRDSLRVPMSWSGDRNAGFSHADFARLYAPPLLDPVYGYETVNVAAQQRDPSSLFHWLRRLVALRKQHPVLARGSLELVETNNPRVLAFVRREGNDIVLVAANVARSAQAVDLELPDFDGLIPVEMSGRSPFPAVTSAPYRLTLAPHAFLWLQLGSEVEEIAVRRRPAETERIAELPQVAWNGDWASLFSGSSKVELEGAVLPPYLRSQRWFGGKARQIAAVELSSATPIDIASRESRRVVIGLLRVRFEAGREDVYVLPMSVATGDEARRLREKHPGWVVARLVGAGEDALLYDALASDSVVCSLMDAIGSDSPWPIPESRVRGVSTAKFSELRGPHDRPLSVHRAPATSSNSLLFLGRRLLLKFFRRSETGVNPDFEIGRFLTEQETFSQIPRIAGMLELDAEDGSTALAILQELVPNQGDGWSHAISELGRYYERASGRMFGPRLAERDPRTLLELADAPPPLSVLEAIGEYRRSARILGRRTAEMHRALAASADHPAFRPEPLPAAELQVLHGHVREQAVAALELLGSRIDLLLPRIVDQARELLSRGEQLDASLARIVPQDGGGRIRVHGDYHLGQVLAVEGDFIILDFEGEPTRTLEERLARQSPLKDIAGMIRSYHYAAYAGLFAFTQDRPEDFARLEPWAIAWYQWNSAAFLKEYLSASSGAAYLPAERADFAGLLDAFMLEKAFYELAYELNNRPEWAGIPLRGVLDLL